MVVAFPNQPTLEGYRVTKTSSHIIVKLVPVTYVNGEWVTSQLGVVLFKDKSTVNNLVRRN